MNILKTTKLRGQGNDCLIESIVTLTNVFDLYEIFIHTKYLGSWCDDKIHLQSFEFSNQEDALKEYNTILNQMSKYEILE